jgi:hypothetical protein
VIKLISGILIIPLFLLNAFLPPAVPQTQVVERLFVPETGHSITNGFLATYQSVKDPQAIFGYPITDAFLDQTSGTNSLVQYFQKALFELHPGEVPELRVEIKWLGYFLYQKGEEAPLLMNSSDCRSFDTNFQVCYALLDFYESNGGVAQFGYPISNLEIQNGIYVQYFQRAAFEWHPEFAPGKRVVLADLGMRFFNTIHEDPLRLRPSAYTIRTILKLQVRAFPKTAVMAISPQGNQSIYVIVQDQNLVPVPNATVVLTVKYPSGIEEPNVLATDDNGIAVIPLTVKEQIAGNVEINVKVSYSSLEQTTRTSFRLWW